MRAYIFGVEFMETSLEDAPFLWIITYATISHFLVMYSLSVRMAILDDRGGDILRSMTRLLKVVLYILLLYDVFAL